MTKKILLADDSITIQKVVRITLADGDYNLITVDNGTEAVERARKEMPDLVLADVVMPGKDGYQVCEEIKKDPALAVIPVILLAGSFEGFDEIKGADVGADGYIIKPFESQALISKVEEMLSRPKPKTRRVEEEVAAKTAPMVQAPAAAAHPGEVDTEVKDFMDSLSAEMDHPAKETKPVAAEPAAEAVPEEPVAEAVPEEPVAEAVLAEPVAAEPEMAEAQMVTEEELWEAEPIESGQVAPGEAVMEAEPVTEEELWAEPMAEEAAAEAAAVQEPEPAMEAQPVMEAPVEEAPVMETEPVYEAAMEAAPEPTVPEAMPSMEVSAEPSPGVTEWEPSPEPELPAEPVEAEPAMAQESYGEVKLEEAPMAAEQESVTAPEADAPGGPEVVPVAEMMEAAPEASALKEEEVPAELETGVPSAQVHAKVAEAAEEIAAAAASGLSRSELVELIRSTVERVAWEVVPELAEALIKERITRWEVQTQ